MSLFVIICFHLFVVNIWKWDCRVTGAGIFSLIRNCKIFFSSQVAVPFTFPPIIYERSNSSPPSTPFFPIFNVKHSNGYVYFVIEVFTVTLICTCLVIKEFEHLFMYLLNFWILAFCKVPPCLLLTFLLDWPSFSYFCLGCCWAFASPYTF